MSIVLDVSASYLLFTKLKPMFRYNPRLIISRLQNQQIGCYLKVYTILKRLSLSISYSNLILVVFVLCYDRRLFQHCVRW